MQATTAARGAAAFLLVTFLAAQAAWGNGGPFVVKHPNGDPAAKGVLARLDPSLKPAEESRLRVVKEDLTIRFSPDPSWRREQYRLPPFAEVTAAYTIENPTDQEVLMDFGFPILRGIYLRFGMVPYPDVGVQIDKEHVYATVISNSAIYGIIRQNARNVIEKGIAADPELLAAAVRIGWTGINQPKSSQPASKQTTNQTAPGAHSPNLDILPPGALQPPATPGMSPAPQPPPMHKPTADYLRAREKLRGYLTAKLGWTPRDAALLVEYVSMAPSIGAEMGFVYDKWDHSGIYGIYSADVLQALKLANLGPFSAIGEQKATQLFAQLASHFDRRVGAAYESIFTAWGGDVREQSIDLETGKIRPRELTLAPPKTVKPGENPPAEYYDQRLNADPTVYARIDYLDPNAKLTKEQKDSCLAVLKNLPVVFTFAPMNLLYYQAKFAPHATRTVTVKYSQYAYADTRGSGSYQLAYVLHPATLWKEFGPIRLTIQLPKGIACKASVATHQRGAIQMRRSLEPDGLEKPFVGKSLSATVHEATLDKPEQKYGELFVGVDKASWDKMFPPTKAKPVPVQQQARQR
jgi:hypothetical protein